ncbi:hypothetical protein B0H16DRAFT_1736105 [Mycena metata]|uniref:Uncharacterized protein n=1 Tax=Mycena metata TaxID=1033252 RepID=A0AAD7HPX7_9AGAR|nr:hypothetical protein B0H16DRAFT_1736105 [Mycena metata]
MDLPIPVADARPPSPPPPAAPQPTELRKIKTWYNHHRHAMGLTSNPYAPWLARFRRPEGSAPKRVTDYQFYMQHEDFKAAVEAEFQARHGHKPREQHLALRCEVAREFFQAEPEQVKERIREEAREEHKEQVELWKDAEEGLPSVREEDQQEARVRFAQVVAPLLNGLRLYTGYHITLIAGRITTENSVDVVSLHAGKTKTKAGPDTGLDFPQWAEDAYKDKLLDHFVRYLIDAHQEPKDDDNGGGPTEDTTTTSTPNPQGPAPLNSTPIPQGPAPLNSTPIPHGPAPLNALANDDEDMPMQLLPPSGLAAVLARPATPPVAGSLEARMATLTVLESPLRRELEGLPSNQRRSRVMELEKMSKLGLQRENNAARDREGALALTESMKQLAATQAAADSHGKRGEKRTAAGKARGGRHKTKRARRASKGSDDGEESAVSSESDATDGEGRVEPPRTRGRARRGGNEEQNGSADGGGGGDDEQQHGGGGDDEHQNQNGAADGGSGVDEEQNGGGDGGGGGSDEQRENDEQQNGGPGAGGGGVGKQKKAVNKGGNVKVPKWAGDALAGLEDVQLDSGWTGWEGMINLWWNIESAGGFAAGKKLSTTNRPTEVQWWIQRARKGTPPIKDPAAFAGSWTRWWCGLNPTWRRGDGGIDAMLKEGGGEEGEWDALDVRGVNGLLSVLMCLKWWRNAVEEEEKDWVMAVADVTWVLEQLTAGSSGALAMGGDVNMK